MQRYTVDLPSYTIGTAAYEAVNDICAPYGRKAALIVGSNGYPRMHVKLAAALLEAGSKLILAETLTVQADCTEEEVERLAAHPSVRDADMIFTIGGGRILDTGKAVAEHAGKPVFTFPTIASNCAAATAVSILYKEDGSFLRPFFLKHSPEHCFIDTEVISQAPPEFLWAGMGDTYAKYYEASIASRGERLNHPLSLGVHLSRQCADNILANGASAYAAHRRGEVTDALEQTILTIIVTTGLVSLLVTLDHSPDYNSDLAHAIYYTLTAIPAFDHVKHLHGAAVGYGVLILLLVDSAHAPEQKTEWKRVAEFNRSVNLPICLADLDLAFSDVEPFLPAITQMADVRHHPYEITEESLRRAFLEQERWAGARG